MKNLASVIVMPQGKADPKDLATVGVKEVCSRYKDMTQAVAENALRIGHLLIDIKEDCKRGGMNFTDLFPKDKSEVGQPGKLPFVARTGQMFMAIAENSALQNTKHASYLPGDWTAIYELSRLPAPELTRIIEAGEVHPEMNRTEVKTVVNRVLRPKSAANEEPQEKPLPAKRVAKIAESCNTKLAELLDADWDVKDADLRMLVPVLVTLTSLVSALAERAQGVHDEG
jgi:hypothetical protein